jgi:hypothetical protein
VTVELLKIWTGNYDITLAWNSVRTHMAHKLFITILLTGGVMGANIRYTERWVFRIKGAGE